MRVTRVRPFALPIHGNQHSQHPKNYKNQKLGNKMEVSTEDSTVRGFKDRGIELISIKV